MLIIVTDSGRIFVYKNEKKLKKAKEEMKKAGEIIYEAFTIKSGFEVVAEQRIRGGKNTVFVDHLD